MGKFSPKADARRASRNNARRMSVCLAVAATLVCVAPHQARAVNAEPYDYTALPDGTNLAIQYLQFGHSDEINIKGAGNLSGNLDTEVGIFRYVRYQSFHGMSYNLQFLVPFGTVNSVYIAGQGLKGSAGIGDPILGATIWPFKNPANNTYFGISVFEYLPLGKYNKNDPINFGNNRYQTNVQLGFQSNFGTSGIGSKFGMSLYADTVFYTKNNRYLGYSNFTQGTTWQIQPWLTYNLSPTSNLSVGYSATGGGKEKVNGVPNGLGTSEEQIRVEGIKFLTPVWQVDAQLTHDLNVSGGFRQDFGLNLRVLHVF